MSIQAARHRILECLRTDPHHAVLLPARRGSYLQLGIRHHPSSQPQIERNLLRNISSHSGNLLQLEVGCRPQASRITLYKVSHRHRRSRPQHRLVLELRCSLLSSLLKIGNQLAHPQPESLLNRHQSPGGFLLLDPNSQLGVDQCRRQP